MYKRLALLAALFGVVALGTHAWAAGTSSISRAGAVALIVEARPASHDRAQWYDKHMPPVSLFTDVDQKLWYAPYIEAAFEEGIVAGSSRKFRPGEPLTIDEALVLVSRLRERMDPPPPPVLFAPGTTEDWKLRALQVAASYELTIPFPVGTGAPITRDQFNDLLESAGIAQPQTIALSIDPKRGVYVPPPVVAAIKPRASQVAAQPHYVQPLQQPVVNRPLVAQVTTPTTTPRPTPQRPAITQPAVQPSSQQTSQTATSVPATTKSFSISMPSLGITDLAITHPSDPFTSQGLLAPLKYGVGHLFSYPGNDGKILIYGHSSSYPWDVSAYTKIFRQINKLAVGDKVYVNKDGTTYVYQVTRHKTVPAGDITSYQGEGEELILYTCWPPDSIQQRYLVIATPVETIAQK